MSRVRRLAAIGVALTLILPAMASADPACSGYIEEMSVDVTGTVQIRARFSTVDWDRPTRAEISRYTARAYNVCNLIRTYHPVNGVSVPTETCFIWYDLLSEAWVRGDLIGLVQPRCSQLSDTRFDYEHFQVPYSFYVKLPPNS